MINQKKNTMWKFVSRGMAKFSFIKKRRWSLCWVVFWIAMGILMFHWIIAWARAARRTTNIEESCGAFGS